MLFESDVPEQSALRVVAETHRHTLAETAAGDHRVVFRKDEIFNRRR